MLLFVMRLGGALAAYERFEPNPAAAIWQMLSG
jgi:hypothetical protein